MHRRHPISTRTDTPIPYTALFRSPNRLATTATLPMPSPSLASLIRKGAMRGFTLIELLVTLVIVALLATAAAPMMQLTAKRAKEHELRRELWEISDSLDAYKNVVDDGMIVRSHDKSGYPPTLQILVKGVNIKNDPQGGTLYFRRLEESRVENESVRN